MTNMNDRSKRKGYRVLLVLMVALAVLSSAMKDLRRLQEFADGLQNVAEYWSGSSLFTASAAAITPEEVVCVEQLEQATNQEFRWTGKVAAGKVIEIRGLNGDIQANGTPGGDVEVVANKHSTRSDVNAVTIKVVEHSDGVTICALYPTDDPNNPATCGPEGVNANRGSHNTRSSDVQVDFKVKVPAGVNFSGRTVNGEISAEDISGNVSTKTVNGSIKITTNGYAEAKTVNGEISARLGNSNWPGSLEFKTVNGEINLELPTTTSASVHASTFNGDITSDFPLTLLGKFSKKEMSGTIGSGEGGRELVLKTLNGRINIQRAGTR